MGTWPIHEKTLRSPWGCSNVPRDQARGSHKGIHTCRQLPEAGSRFPLHVFSYPGEKGPSPRQRAAGEYPIGYLWRPGDMHQPIRTVPGLLQEAGTTVDSRGLPQTSSSEPPHSPFPPCLPLHHLPGQGGSSADLSTCWKRAWLGSSGGSRGSGPSGRKGSNGASIPGAAGHLLEAAPWSALYSPISTTQ